ncbi:DegT/DnrJ/EryC1/StrS family aminotransferase [Methanogenium organophilum]|uniref:DegT/DnrJ/EryC1/StrS family aminotransferase n=1 Tax=Methanogenium organophilum TaxID=2199 RepID=A0A9X9T8P7_METOG|nr:DegT/DnrJ/EryC1/StrS family aminotransferase [Methanogenium organophilum]WAI01377.1 DegT/DnrJ/EryC1/StrS family aminotransferase [Methanogenium organophilum]
MIPIAKPTVGEEEIAAVAAAIRTGMLATGPEVTAFEEEFADYCNVEHAVGMNTGTAALHTALRALGIGHGDEVIVPAFTFIATATAVSMCGAKPVMVDVDERSYTIDPEEVSEYLNAKTKAVIGVHLFGQPFAVDPVAEICADADVLLVEDCAQAHGAMYRGEKVGGFGAAGCFSFYPTKNMTTGEGGMVTTNDPLLAERCRRIANHGQSDKYLHTELGYNYRMTSIGAAIGRVQLRKLDAMNRRRQANAAYYTKHLDAFGLNTPLICAGCTHVFHQYVTECTDAFPTNRETLMAYLLEKGIGTAVHYPMPVHHQPFYAGDPGVVCPVSDELSGRVLSLPVHPGVTEEDCAYIVETINGAEW